MYSTIMKKQVMKSVQSVLSKMMKKLKFLSKPKNSTKVLLLVAGLLVLYLVHKNYLKEGMAVRAENFEDEVSTVEGKALVLFHAPWCGHCKKIMPQWDEATKAIKDKPGVSMMKVECGSPQENKSHASIMEKYGIQGYPTIKVFENGIESGEFEGKRSKEGLLSALGL